MTANSAVMEEEQTGNLVCAFGACGRSTGARAAVAAGAPFPLVAANGRGKREK
jgi:hypothetical protein